MESKEKRSYMYIIKKLLELVKDLKLFLFLAVVFGSLGNIFASLIPTTGAIGLAEIYFSKINFIRLAIIFIVLVIGRALFKYFEQLANHYVAFRTLQLIRDRVFIALRKLSPAKLEVKNKGELISYISSDIELLEVFYAHTISPVLIAIVHSTFSIIFLLKYSYYYSLLIFLFHLVMATLVPIITTKRGQHTGDAQRSDLSRLNSIILDTFLGIKESIQYNLKSDRMQKIKYANGNLNLNQRKLSKIMAQNQSLAFCIILLGDISVLLVASYLYKIGKVDIDGIIVPVVYFISSFGPVMALSNLANNLLLTFACGRRISALLDEEPIVEDVVCAEDIDFEELEVKDLSFGYESEEILRDVDLSLKKSQIKGIMGSSGSGKSTLLKLIMGFYPFKKGEIEFNSKPLKSINTESLRKNQTYLTQDMYLFKGTILENIRLSKPGASLSDVMLAAKKASIDKFIEKLPKSYDTQIDYVKDTISTGQMQRICLARAFLHDGDLFILDEPTSNIDSLNEGIILKSLYQEAKEKAILIVSHKRSTLRIADEVIEIKRNRKS